MFQNKILYQSSGLKRKLNEKQFEAGRRQNKLSLPLKHGFTLIGLQNIILQKVGGKCSSHILLLF
jgi:hypothetical protein